MGYDDSACNQIQNQIGLSWEQGLEMEGNVNTSMLKFFLYNLPFEGIIRDFVLRFLLYSIFKALEFEFVLFCL